MMFVMLQSNSAMGQDASWILTRHEIQYKIQSLPASPEIKFKFYFYTFSIYRECQYKKITAADALTLC